MSEQKISRIMLVLAAASFSFGGVSALIYEGRTMDLEGRDNDLEARLQRLEARMKPPEAEPVPPRAGEVVQISRPQPPPDAYAVKLEGRVRGDACLLPSGDLKLTVLDLREDWMMVRFERTAVPAEADADGSCPGSDGLLAIRIATFQQYRDRSLRASRDAAEASWSLHEFYRHFPAAPL